MVYTSPQTYGSQDRPIRIKKLKSPLKNVSCYFHGNCGHGGMARTNLPNVLPVISAFEIGMPGADAAPSRYHEDADSKIVGMDERYFEYGLAIQIELL